MPIRYCVLAAVFSDGSFDGVGLVGILLNTPFAIAWVPAFPLLLMCLRFVRNCRPQRSLNTMPPLSSLDSQCSVVSDAQQPEWLPVPIKWCHVVTVNALFCGISALSCVLPAPTHLHRIFIGIFIGVV